MISLCTQAASYSAGVLAQRQTVTFSDTQSPTEKIDLKLAAARVQNNHSAVLAAIDRASRHRNRGPESAPQRAGRRIHNCKDNNTTSETVAGNCVAKAYPSPPSGGSRCRFSWDADSHGAYVEKRRHG